MRRLFGGGGAPRSAPDLDATVGKLDARCDELSAKVAKCDGELLRLKAQMQRAPGNDGLRRQALQVLAQKRGYEQQLALVMGQTMNLQQAAFAKQNLDVAAETVDAMRAATRQMKSQMAALPADSVASLHDDLAEMVAQAAEVSEVLGQSFATPDGFDCEDDLMAELEMLDAGGSEASYLDVSIPTSNPAREQAPASSAPRGYESPLPN